MGKTDFLKCGNCYDGKLLMAGESCGMCGNKEPKARKPDYTARTKALRKTLYPMSAKEVSDARSLLCLKLFKLGTSFRELRQIFNLSGPDQARNYVAKGKRLCPE